MTIVEHQPHRGAPPDDLPTTMQAGVLVGTRALELRTFEVPRPGPGQALVRIRATALCTWEQRTYQGIQDIKTPFVGGHETAGVVAAVGEGVRLSSVGDRVTLGPVDCGECDYCRRGYPARCEQRLGGFSLDGAWGPWGLAEYKLVPARAVFGWSPRRIHRRRWASITTCSIRVKSP